MPSSDTSTLLSVYPSESPGNIPLSLPSSEPSKHPNKEPSYVPIIPSKKYSQITSTGPSDHPSVSPSVATSVYSSPFTSITPTIFPSDVLSEKPMMLVWELIDSWMDIEEVYFQKSTDLYTLMSQYNKVESAISISSPFPSKEPTKDHPISYPPIQVYFIHFSLSQVQLVIQIYPNQRPKCFGKQNIIR